MGVGMRVVGKWPEFRVVVGRAIGHGGGADDHAHSHFERPTIASIGGGDGGDGGGVGIVGVEIGS